jgi:hypothetical protein
VTARERWRAARAVCDPIVVIYGAETRARSKAEMSPLGRLPNVQTRELPRGKLGVQEEFPKLVAEAIKAFLGKTNGAAPS